jgi:hypothetical protein
MNEEWIDLGDPAPIQVKRMIGGKKYILKEPSEATEAKFNSLAARGATMQDGKVSIGTHVGELELFLVAQCLWECDADGNPIKPVPESTIRGWSSRVVKPLYDKCQEMAGKKAESPERKALLAALSDKNLILNRMDYNISIDLELFRIWAKSLVERDAKLYAPLWELVKPQDELEVFDPKK